MGRMVYCVARTPLGHEPQLDFVEGPAGKRIEIVPTAGLSAVVSEWTGAQGIACTEVILDYGGVIERFWKKMTVVPMRFGNVLGGDEAVKEMLETRSARIFALLDELADTAEMGLKVVSPCDEASQSSGMTKKVDQCISAGHSGTGKSYLASKRAFFQLKEQDLAGREKIAEQFSQVFSGLFIKVKHECKSDMISMSFLVKKNDAASFKVRFHEMCEKESAELLLSGPWPPYSFAEL